MTLHSAVLTQEFLNYPREKSAFHISPWNRNVQQAWLSQQGRLLQTLAAAFSGSVTEPALICPCQHSPDKGNALPFRKNAKVWPTSLPPISSSVAYLLISPKDVAIWDAKAVWLWRLFLVTALPFISRQLYTRHVYTSQNRAAHPSLNHQKQHSNTLTAPYQDRLALPW